MQIVVLISGSGTNLQAIINRLNDETQTSINANIAAVISNRPGVKGLERAEQANIPTKIVDHTQYDSRENFDAALQTAIDKHSPDLVVLAGFMRILTPEFVRNYHDRMLNIHPSLLPKYQGLHTHKRALEAGDKVHGVSIHYVSEELDGGPIVVQAQVPILNDDTEETLAQRIHSQEYLIYPLAIEWLATGRLHFQQGKPFLDNELLPKQGYQINNFAEPDK